MYTDHSYRETSYANIPLILTAQEHGYIIDVFWRGSDKMVCLNETKDVHEIKSSLLSRILMKHVFYVLRKLPWT
jgi:hypothetical protein